MLPRSLAGDVTISCLNIPFCHVLLLKSLCVDPSCVSLLLTVLPFYVPFKSMVIFKVLKTIQSTDDGKTQYCQVNLFSDFVPHVISASACVVCEQFKK